MTPTYNPRRRFFLGKSQSRAPTPAKPLYHSFFSPFGGESLTKGNSLYAYPAGASFCADKRMQKRFRAAP